MRLAIGEKIHTDLRCGEPHFGLHGLPFPDLDVADLLVRKASDGRNRHYVVGAFKHIGLEEPSHAGNLGERLDQRAALEELHVHLVTRAIIDERLDLQPPGLLELNVHSPDFAPLDLNALHYPALLGISAVCTFQVVCCR